MRCARCDRLVNPQAVGLTPEGRLAFGWCVACLRETDCLEVVVAWPRRRLRLRPKAWARALTRTRRHGPSTHPLPSRKTPAPLPTPMEERLKVVGAVALMIGFWGLALFSVGLFLWSKHVPRPSTPAGNGTPPLLLGGGGFTAAVGLGLWGFTSGRQWLRTRWGLRVVQVLSLGVGLCVLYAGRSWHSPGGDSLVVALAATALLVMIVARRAGLRLEEPSLPGRRYGE